MDIVRFKGGIGNQMFQYAFLYSLMKRGRDAYANLKYYDDNDQAMPFVLNEVFPSINIPLISNYEYEKKREKWENQKKILDSDAYSLRENAFCIENEDSTYDDGVYNYHDCVFIGYWQSEKYFKGISESLRNQFVFSNLEDNLRLFGNKLFEENYAFIHVRRGDYLSNQDYYYNLCVNDYYNSAIKYVNSKYDVSNFIIFSDDIEWCSKEFSWLHSVVVQQDDYVYYRDWYDMYLMSCCKYCIIANSSFSWWGAWLNRYKDKVVIAPINWILGKKTPDICPEGWVRL